VSLAQPVDVIPLVQVVYNVKMPLVFVLVMLDTKGQNVILLVDVTQLDQAAFHVISLQVNVLVILDTQEPPATLVTLTTIEQVMEHAQLVDVMPPVLGICNVWILPDSAPAMLVTRV